MHTSRETVFPVCSFFTVLALRLIHSLRKAIPRKNLLLFGHYQNFLDPPPPLLIWTPTRNFAKKKVQFV